MRKWLVQYRCILTNDQVALLAVISRSAYSNIETGMRDPSFKMAKKIALALKFDLRIFFYNNCVYTNQKSA